MHLGLNRSMGGFDNDERKEESSKNGRTRRRTRDRRLRWKSRIIFKQSEIKLEKNELKNTIQRIVTLFVDSLGEIKNMEWKVWKKNLETFISTR